jgi:hypothetical protein
MAGHLYMFPRYIFNDLHKFFFLGDTIFCDVTPRALVKVRRRFGGTNLFQLPGRRISAVLVACFGPFFDPDDGSSTFL